MLKRTVMRGWSVLQLDATSKLRISPGSHSAWTWNGRQQTSQSVTNRWLELMDPKLRVELKAYDEDSKAATQAISLKIQGRTTGDEYVDLSTGERLRVDLAFLFGFAEVTELIHGGSATLGTLWLDEVFDGVDDEGVESAIDLIRHVAEKRAVVVITHNDRLKLKLQPDIIYALKKAGTP